MQKNFIYILYIDKEKVVLFLSLLFFFVCLSFLSILFQNLLSLFNTDLSGSFSLFTLFTNNQSNGVPWIFQRPTAEPSPSNINPSILEFGLEPSMIIISLMAHCVVDHASWVDDPTSHVGIHIEDIFSVSNRGIEVAFVAFGEESVLL